MKKQETRRVIVTLPANAYNALRRMAEFEEVPMAAIVRHALITWMQSQGIRVTDNVVWGGARYTPEDSDEGEHDQVMAEYAG